MEVIADNRDQFIIRRDHHRPPRRERAEMQFGDQFQGTGIYYLDIVRFLGQIQPLPVG